MWWDGGLSIILGFKHNIIGTFELTGIGLALIVFFSYGYAQLKGDHILVEVLIEKFPRRVRAALELIAYAIFFVLLILVMWQLVSYAQRLYSTGQTTPDLGMPLYLFAYIGSLGILFFILTILVKMGQLLKEVVTRHGD